MKKLMALTISLLLVLGMFTGCSNNSNDAATTNSGSGENGESVYDELNLKLTTAGTDLSVETRAANKLAELVDEASDGKIKIDVYSGSQLAGGSQEKTIDLLMQGGSFELAAISGSVLVNIGEQFQTHMMPFAFESYEEASKYLDGTGGEYYAEKMAEKGITAMGIMHTGLRHFTTSDKEIRTPEDFENLKIRVPAGELFMKTFEAMGANPTAIGWGEVYTALQQGTVDGQENGYQSIKAAGLQDVQNYITEVSWGYNAYWFVANSDEWNSWNEATQDLLMEKSIEAAEWARNSTVEDEKQIKQEFIDMGITITELTKEERQAFIDKAQPVREYFIEKFGDEAVRAWGIID